MQATPFVQLILRPLSTHQTNSNPKYFWCCWRLYVHTCIFLKWIKITGVVLYHNTDKPRDIVTTDQRKSCATCSTYRTRGTRPRAALCDNWSMQKPCVVYIHDARYMSHGFLWQLINAKAVRRVHIRRAVHVARLVTTDQCKSVRRVHTRRAVHVAQLFVTTEDWWCKHSTIFKQEVTCVYTLLHYLHKKQSTVEYWYNSSSLRLQLYLEYIEDDTIQYSNMIFERQT